MKEKKLCTYGCGKEAKYYFKSVDKWCCSKNWQSCSVNRKKISLCSKGRFVSEETRKKLSEFNKGKVHTEKTKRKISKGNKGKIRSKQTRKKLSKLNKGKILSIETRKKISISNKGRIVSSETRKKLSESGKFLIKQIKEKYPTFSKIEKMRYNPDNPSEKEIQVHCKNHKCVNSKEQDGWFTPTRSQLFDRIKQIENNDGNGGSYLYCCNECKQECPLYNKRVSILIKEDLIYSGHLEDPWYNSTEYQIWRQQVFELDNFECQYCGQPSTISHHILPQKTHPELSLDPENGISVCEKCHYKYGHKGECSTGNLSKLTCERIVRIKKKGEING